MIFKVVVVKVVGKVLGKVVGRMVVKVVGKMVVKVVVVVDVHVVPIDQCDSDKSCLIVDPIPPFEVRIWSGWSNNTTSKQQSQRKRSAVTDE